MLTRLLMLLCGLCACAPAFAVWVRVVAIGPGYAQLEINQTTVHTLRPGQQSPEGVKLLSLTATHAEVEANGAAQKLSLGQRMAPMAVLQADARGHYAAEAFINGRRTPVLVDTGASGVALSRNEAERLGIAWQAGRRISVRTAAGESAGHVVMLDSIQLGGITLRQVEAIVSVLPDAPPIALLGMTFLNRVEMLKTGNRLQLIQLR